MKELKENDKLDETMFENIKTKYAGELALEEEGIYKDAGYND
jgi:hypothetical protein